MVSIARIKRCTSFLIGLLSGIFVFILSRNVLEPSLRHFIRASQAYNQQLSDHLFNDVKVACIVVTNPASHRTKAIYIKNTWGKRCNKLFFVTTQEDSELDTIVLPLNESKSTLRKKIKGSFLHVHDFFFNDFDWLLKADDDKYEFNNFN